MYTDRSYSQKTFFEFSRKAQLCLIFISMPIQSKSSNTGESQNLHHCFDFHPVLLRSEFSCKAQLCLIFMSMSIQSKNSNTGESQNLYHCFDFHPVLLRSNWHLIMLFFLWEFSIYIYIYSLQIYLKYLLFLVMIEDFSKDNLFLDFLDLLLLYLF